MKAVLYDKYGTADELYLSDIATPEPSDDQLLLHIKAVSINGSDREKLAGKPLYGRLGGAFTPKSKILGSDVAGVVVKTGKNITRFSPGDAVYGELPGYHGGFAEYVCTHDRNLAIKPPELSYPQAAAIPQAGVIALEGIVKQGQLAPGQKVLINGAGGSAGAFAIQLAKMCGADVTAVDSEEKFALMADLGADHLIDYRRENFTRSRVQHHLILDLIAQHSIFRSRRVLVPGGRYFYVGGSMGVLAQVLLLGGVMKAKSFRVLAAAQNSGDVIEVTQLCLAGKLRLVIDRTFPLAETRQAFNYLAAGHCGGKVIITPD